jgi:hypothetical protein
MEQSSNNPAIDDLLVSPGSLSRSLGQLVQISCAKETYKGHIYALNRLGVVLQITSPKDADIFDLVYILTSSITNCTNCNSPKTLIGLPKITPQQATQKVGDAVKAELEKQQHYGVGVSAEAQVFASYLDHL